MQARFIGEAFEGLCHLFGEAFAAGKWTHVDHLPDAHRAALIGNPTFETRAHDDEAETLAKRVAADKITAETPTEGV